MFLDKSSDVAAALFLAVYGDESVLWLKIASGVLGFGTAAIYATGLLWLEQYMKITNRIGVLPFSCLLQVALGQMFFL